MNKFSMSIQDMFLLIAGGSAKISISKALFISKHLKLGSKVIIESIAAGGEVYTAYAFISNIEDENPADTAANFLVSLDFINYLEETNG